MSIRVDFPHPEGAESTINSGFTVMATLRPSPERTRPGARRRGRRLPRRELRGGPIIYMSPAETLDSYGDAFFMNLYKEAGYRPNILFCSSDIESILMMACH